MVIRQEPTYTTLTNLYDVIRNIFKNDKYYYKDVKQAKEKIIIRKDK